MTSAVSFRLLRLIFMCGRRAGAGVGVGGGAEPGQDGVELLAGFLAQRGPFLRGFPADLGELGPQFLGGGAVLAGAAFEAAPAWPVTATEPPISYRDQSASHGA